MLPKVNQMLYYQIATSDESEAALEYRSRIADDEGGAFLIELPISEKTGRLKRLFLGDELSVYFVSADGVKHYFDSHVLGFKEDGMLRLVKIMRPDPERMTKVQRRSFLRMSATLDLAVKLSNHERFVSQTDDVGGGGISFICDSKWNLKAESMLDCWLLIPYKNGSIEHAPFRAEVVRINELESGLNQVMLKFELITDTDRGKIIRYCFEKQLEFRNR